MTQCMETEPPWLLFKSQVAPAPYLHPQNSASVTPPTSLRHPHILTAVLIQSYLFIGLFPETSHDEDHGHGRLQVGADGLDVNEELAPLACLDHGDPEDGA